MNPAQELFFTHLDDSLAAFKVALRRAINIDDNRESHLDDAGAARDELARAAAQLLFTLGLQQFNAMGRPLSKAVVDPSTNVFDPGTYATLPGTQDHFLRSAFTIPPEEPSRDWVSLGDLSTLIPRL